MIKKSVFFLIALLLASAWAGLVSGADKKLYLSHDLTELSKLAKHEKKLILLLVSLEDCPYCERLKADVLNPMMQSKSDYQHVLFAEIQMDDTWAITDFNGQNLTGSDWARKAKVYTAPTLLLLDADGQALSKPTVGYTSPDFYPFYLDQKLESARKKLQS